MLIYACLFVPPHMATSAPSFCELGKYFWTVVTAFHLLSISLVWDRAANGKAEYTINLQGNCLFPVVGFVSWQCAKAAPLSVSASASSAEMCLIKGMPSCRYRIS